MSTTWVDFLKAEGAHFSVDQIVDDFGNAEAEREATATGSIVANLSTYALLRVQGEDAQNFLQGQLTCDVNALETGECSYGAYCTAKGRMLGSFLIFRDNEGYALLMSRDIAAATQKRLQMFVLRAKVKIEDLSERTVLLGLSGSHAGAAFTEAGYAPSDAAMRIENHGACIVLRLDDKRYIALIEDETLARSLWQQFKLSLKPVGDACWQWLDIVRGIPWITAPTQEQFVPQMANLEKIGGVSFKKGCYPGQEIVARTQYLGKANRRMRLAHCAAQVQTGDAVYGASLGDQACGMVANAAPAPEGGWDALVVLNNGALEGPVHAQGLQGPTLDFRALPYNVD